MKIINLGILAHVDAGKTTLTESLLYTSGAIAELGSVDEGTTRTDTMNLERQRGITIQTAVTSFQWEDVKVNIIDTPGHMDFLAEVYRSLSVLDGAVLLVSAKDGIQAQTRILFHALQIMKIPTIFFINKIDQEGIDLPMVYREMKAEATGNPLILLQVQLNSDLRQEEMLYSGYKRQIHNNEESLITNLSKIELLKKDIAKMEILNSIIKENNSEHFQGKYYINDDEKDFIIFKNDTSDLNKSRQAELERNFEKIVKTIADDYQKEYKVLEFKGLLVSGERTDLNTLNFYVSTTDGKTIMEPENLIYKRDEKTFFKLESYVNFGGFVKRLNNFYNDLEKFTQLNKNKIENLEKEIVELKSITGDNTPKYKRKDYLEALREDNRIIMDEIEKMSKQKNYKSGFVPKSAKILEDLNKNNNIQKEYDIEI
ncbi:TPA_asm: hypothetical protein GD957_09245 [Campylobacter coli]|nr:hypothetical protein [Campylobacter coli]